MASKGSAYREFVTNHRQFLAKYPEAKERQRKRPWRFIEEVGLECAVWPHLYWKRSMTESYARSTDERRLARTGRKQARFAQRAEAADAAESGEDVNSEEEDDDLVDFEEDEEDDDDFVEGGRRSAKGSFMAKVLSPIIGYGSDYELMQYVWDLNMWSSLGGKKNACKNTPLRDTWQLIFFRTKLVVGRGRAEAIQQS